MPWIALCIAGLCEIGWAVGMKYSEGFTRPLATVITIVLIVLSLGLLNLALRTLPLGTAYGIWTGIGTAGTALVGIVLFGEAATVARITCLSAIVIGIIGLRLVSDI